jgi:hypothetical protein
MLHLGFQGLVNERDKEAMELAVARARCYLDYLFRQNKFKYPAVGMRHKDSHDGTDLNAWIPQTLSCTEQQAKSSERGSRILVLPPTNTPHNVKKNMTAEEFKQVLFGYGLCEQ